MLSSAMSLLRKCRVNAALTIQLFSQLFHYINMWLFNELVLVHGLCTRAWGSRLKARLSRVESWAEKQGLELAADCHLARIVQVEMEKLVLDHFCFFESGYVIQFYPFDCRLLTCWKHPRQ